MSVLSYLDRILTELRQLLELGTVTIMGLEATIRTPTLPNGIGETWRNQPDIACECRYGNEICTRTRELTFVPEQSESSPRLICGGR
jgi:hypothetical protein